MKNCWAETYCKGYPGSCSDICLGYMQLNILYTLSRIPTKYQYPIPLKAPESDVEQYYALREYMDNVEERVNNATGIFIYSPTKGNGKTTWATKIMNHYFRKIALSNNMRCRGLFINIPEFLERLKEGFNNPQVSEEMSDLKDDIRQADLVIWDDIGTEAPTEWVRLQLYTFINHRDGNGLANIYTSNLPLDILMQDRYLGDRIGSRIYGQCKDYLIHFEGIDRRIN